MLQDALSQLGKGIHQISDLGPLNQISLIVIDQFAELFAQAKAGPRYEFVALLQVLPSFDQIHAHFIATLQSDYLKELSGVKALGDVVTQGIVLRAMSEDSLRKAILKPLQEKYPDKRIEPELLASLAPGDRCGGAKAHRASGAVVGCERVLAQGAGSCLAGGLSDARWTGVKRGPRDLRRHDGCGVLCRRTTIDAGAGGGLRSD